PGRAILLEQEDRPAHLRDEGLPDPGKQVAVEDPGVLRARVLPDVLRVEGEEIAALPSSEVRDLEPSARPDSSRAAFAGRDVDAATGRAHDGASWTWSGPGRP